MTLFLYGHKSILGVLSEGHIIVAFSLDWCLIDSTAD